MVWGNFFQINRYYLDYSGISYLYLIKISIRMDLQYPEIVALEDGDLLIVEVFSIAVNSTILPLCPPWPGCPSN